MKKQGNKRERKKKNDSDDSDWSQIDKPGESRVDKLIRQRNRFSMHYHKEDFISIPEENRFPLLPNEEIYDWEEQRKLLIINKEIHYKQQPILKKKPNQYLQQVNGQKDEVDNLVNNEWVNVKKEEINHRLRTQSMRLLECASKQPDLQLSKLDNVQLPQLPQQGSVYKKRLNKNQAKYFYHDEKIKKKRGRPRKKPRSQDSADQMQYRDILPQPHAQETLKVRNSLKNTAPAEQMQNSRFTIAPQASQDESMDISLDIQQDNQESFFNVRHS